MPSGEVALFFLLLFLFYLAEGVWRVAPGAVAFGGSWLAPGFRPLGLAFPRGRDRSGYGISPAGPGALALVTGSWPLLPTPDRVIPVPSSPGPVLDRAWPEEDGLGYEEAARVTVSGNRLRLDGRTLAHATSSRAANHIARLIRELAPLDPASRSERILAEFASAVDAQECSRALARLEELGSDVAVLSALALLNLFVVAPLLVVTRPIQDSLLIPLSLHAVIALLCTWRLLVLYREFHPGEESALQKALLVALFPPSTARAYETLGMGLLDAWHPVTAAAVLLRGTSRLRTLRRIAPGWLLETGPAADSGGSPAETELFRRMREMLTGQLTKSGVVLEDVTAAPGRDADAVSYCPFCRVQYRDAPAVCPECEGAPLRRFPERKEP